MKKAKKKRRGKSWSDFRDRLPAPDWSKLDLSPQFVVTLNFGNGLFRKFTLCGDAAERILKGEILHLETCHPKYGEMLIVRTAPK